MADFDVKTVYSTAFRTFVDFAEKTSKDGYDSANAKATLASRMLTVSPLSLHETSYILRKTAEKDSNNATRDLFRQAIIDMFGGEAKIPESVKDAMLLDDFGHGYPLTARRIMAVKKEVDSVLKNHAAFNNRIGVVIEAIRTANPDIELKWDECAAVVKHYLKGETLGIQKAEKEDYGDGDYMWNFVPVTEGGKPVVREITDEDLDELGPAVLDFCTQ